MIIVFSITIVIVVKKSLNNLTVNIPDIIITIKKDGSIVPETKTENLEPKVKYIINADTSIKPTNELNVKFPTEENIIKDEDKPEKKSECGCGVKNENKKLTYDFNKSEKQYNDKDINELNFDPYIHYRQHQEYVKTYLEDPKTRGYNMDDMYADAMDIGVDKKEELISYPKPSGYTFEQIKN
jgi:hypothetical protein